MSGHGQGQDVQTLKMKAARKHDNDHERRRSSTLRLEPPQSDSRKATSFVRARTSGVNRLLRSNTSSTGVLKTPHEEYDTALAEPVNENAVEPPPSPTKSGPKSGSSTSSPPISNGLLNGDEVDEDGLPPYQELKWTHVVLKMTAFSEEDAVTSFRFDVNGGGIGRSADNAASIPADKLLAGKDHARVLYSGGRFYLANGDNSSDTFVRLSPCGAGADEDEPEDRMQWPLEPHVSFRVGKSDFLVTAFHEPSQSLEVSALSGKLAGSHFTIGREGAGIGRSAENKIHTGDGELSRKHAAIWFDELTNQFYLVDLNSTNGTFMKLVGSYQEPYRLEIGDDLLVAQTCLTVNRFDFGAHADMGARKHMEDAHTVIQDLCIESLSRLGMHPQSYFAVYDGHGGEEASAFLGDVLHHNIIEEFYMKKTELKTLLSTSQEELQSMITKRLTDAFERTDEEFLNESERPQAGSTATTVFVAGKYMFVSNVGDSRTVLSRGGKAERLSNDHKPSRPDEAQRIRDTGGFVIHGRIMGELAVSRAFGDVPFKTFDLPEPPSEDADSDKPRSDYDSQELPVNPNDILKGPLVIPTPEITITELTDDCEFVMLASDGLYDVLKDQEAVDFMRQKIVQLNDVQRAVEAIVEYAIFHQRSTDNVTCVVVMFKEPKDLK
ncbi:protein phosphatase 2C 11 [Phytophthora cinnamomi]|uniref:protein phosphatase 2C 11 n=1 Tax=Phytophthora cinnamomi TaxID=4785 RepID=UPI00355A79E4|nr:protein phosphatase 2C 11 [Phytophthora cinnamomi]